ncbi:MAG: transcriptional repressor LexA [Deltaproteobacteria bacterium]|nr:transcriptional repressor LexA [Deltaproteobacteria bacterium]
METITEKQKEVYNLIVESIKRLGYPPSLREIGAAMKITPNAVRGYLDALVKKGYIERDSIARGIRVIKPLDKETSVSGNGDIVTLPIIGRIQAGLPILAIENIEGEVSLSKDLRKGLDGCFLLRVQGDSMVEDHILEGDLAIVKPQETAENGKIVVALVNDEATIKRFYREKTRIRLQPANPLYEPIYVERDFKVQGKVIGLIRI